MLRFCWLFSLACAFTICWSIAFGDVKAPPPPAQEIVVFAEGPDGRPCKNAWVQVNVGGKLQPGVPTSDVGRAIVSGPPGQLWEINVTYIDPVRGADWRRTITIVPDGKPLVIRMEDVTICK